MIDSIYARIESFDSDDDGPIVNLLPGWCFDNERGLHCFGISDDEDIRDYEGRVFECDCTDCIARQ